LVDFDDTNNTYEGKLLILAIHGDRHIQVDLNPLGSESSLSIGCRRGALSGHSNMVGRSLYIGTVRVGEHKFTMSSLNFSLIISEKFSNSNS
jgi:hypothetical protein